MTFDNVVNSLFKMWVNAMEKGHKPQTVTLRGAPGIGKTSAARELSRRMTEYMQWSMWSMQYYSRHECR